MTEVGLPFQDESVWQKFLNHTRESVIDVDFRTRRIRCSPQLALSVKLTAETLPRNLDQWFELYHPDDYIKSLDFRRHVFESEEDAFSVERRLYCGDGRYRWFRLDAVCLRDGEGKAQRLVGVETDIAPQKFDEQRHEEQLALARGLEERLALLREENQRLTARLSQRDLHCQALEKRLSLTARMLDAAPGFLFHCEADGRLSFCNAAFAEALSRNPRLSKWAAHSEEDGFYEDAHGRPRILTMTRYPVAARDGGTIGAASDVTEIREMEADMARLKRLFGKNALHESVNEAVPENTLGDENTFPGEILGKYLNGVMSSLSNALTRKFFPARKLQIENLLRASEGMELEVGVVGITSSGKSTFINAMMGERLLPEETRATTNLVVRCRKGEERAVTAVLRSGERERVSGAQLTAGWMESAASERLNPSNRQAIAFLEWTSPGAALPQGLVLVDTPGLDACDFPEHSEFLLRQLLPTLDIVIYVTSIRN
ncbi:MAG: dynamin family protein, partial [Synergistaceae bacterium]|nr:dynamin family protein [Synergistaceae bacterium]